MYEHQTKAAILQRMLEATPEDLDTRQGSVTFDLLSPAAIELAHAYIELDNVLRFGFAGPDQPSEFLDMRAREFGLSRRPSVKAEGEVVFVGDENTIVPIGTAVSTDEENSIVFVTAQTGTIKQGKASVKAIAATGGDKGNIAAGRIKLMLGNLSGIVSVTNPQPFINGADIESDESLLGRYFDRVRRPATSGNVWHYRQWALEVPGVGDVKVFPVWEGNGTVKLAVLSDDKRAPVPSILEQVKTVVEERRPVGALVTVSPALEVAINVSARLTLAPGAVLDEVKGLFVKELTAYLAELAFHSTIVPYNRIFGLLLDIASVSDFSDLKINGVSGNLQLDEEQVAVAGAVSFVAL
ncbi:putative phage protein gp47/JayE [Fontibacillus phaseoli]|uniref:Putative phage protein gp47/JayE n=1 Tax=Fontibacillus phaseoli TaxID=1416533 RepID=A0A369B7F5_9BACL|nr:baseplate J/gp47 family protein [Fontibacillus phaseoli]RCX16467.1 putative phage protein gp47/JayE [Fontibacillus phaseoli]